METKKFTQRAHYRLQTMNEYEAVIRKLEEIGYTPVNAFKPDIIPGYICISLGKYTEFGFLGIPSKPSQFLKSIDCDIDIRLFMDLAEMREDTDKNQWFIYDDTEWNIDQPQKFLFKCTTDSIEEYMKEDMKYLDCKRASIEEILRERQYKGN